MYPTLVHKTDKIPVSDAHITNDKELNGQGVIA